MPAILRRLLLSIITVVVLAAAMFGLHAQLRNYPELKYPPEPDQINYLDEAPAFHDHLLVDPKVPLYTVWFSLFYATTPNLYWSFYVEHYALVLLLSVLMAFLGYRLFDRRTGMMLGLATLNAKYFVLEPNGSNGLAAAMVAAAALCLTSKKSLRWPAAILFLFLSMLARPEMLIPLALVCAYLLVKAVVWFRARRQSAKLSASHWYQWAGALLIIVSLTAFVKTHSNVSAPWSTSYAYFCSVAVNYINRENLRQQYPCAFCATPEIIKRLMPRVTEPVSGLASPLRGIVQAWTLYPRECLQNTAYNVKMAAITLPAIMLGFSSRVVMLLALGAWVGSYFFWRGSNRQNFAQTSGTTWRDLAALAISSSSLIGVTLFFMVMWRYYFPMLPVFMVGWAYLVHRGLDRIQNRRRL